MNQITSNQIPADVWSNEAQQHIDQAAAELQKLLPEGYRAREAMVTGDPPFRCIMLHVPPEIWDLVKDYDGFKWQDEVHVPLPFEMPDTLWGYRILIEWTAAFDVEGAVYVGAV